MRRVVLSSLALMLGGSAAASDQVVVRGTAGIINDQLQTSLNSFGSSFAERNRLADERRPVPRPTRSVTRSNWSEALKSRPASTGSKSQT